MTRLKRADIAERNRAAVLAAASRQFEEHGFHGATLDAIADAAGFSKGVVYSRFGSKDELFLALLAENIEKRHQQTAERFEVLRGPDDLPRLAELSIRESVRTVAWQAALLEFRAHAWRNPELNERYRELHRRTVESISGFIAGLYDRAGVEPPESAAAMAVVALAMGTGTVAEFMADADLDVARVAALLAPVSGSWDHTTQGEEHR